MVMQSTLEIVPFTDWHPEITYGVWERLARGTKWSKFRERGLDKKDHWRADGTDSITYRDALEYFLDQYRVAFAIEHFVAEQSMVRPRILEVGSWPMRNPLVSAQFGNTLISMLSQNEDYTVAGVDNIDTETVFPYKSWTPPNFGSAKMFYGDMHKEQTRAGIADYLGGLPNLIGGNMVFEKRMGAWCIEERNRGLALRTGLQLPTNLPTGEYAYVVEELARTCNSFLAPEGVLVVCNRDYGEIPDFVERMPLLRIYEDEKGRELVQFRAKIS